jgi:hypothetical protein
LEKYGSGINLFMDAVGIMSEIINESKGEDKMNKPKRTILPYPLREKIWELIHQGKENHQIVEEVYKEAEPFVTSVAQLIQCITAHRSLHTKGLRPSPKNP